jgi:EAL domain-containing protein (putative c-di-GMP-specific phosphodiesterase class I)
MSDPNPRILIADDSEANVRLLEAILARAGFTDVVSTTKPDEVLALFRASKPQLILLDLHMPGLDGFQVMAQIREALTPMEFLPILIMTADLARPSRDRALEEGANDFLTKPVDRTEVTLRVRNLLHTRALYRQLHEYTAHLQVEVDRERKQRRQLESEKAQVRQRVQRVLDGLGMEIHVQPIVDLGSGAVAGVEALARFSGPPHRGPDEWFAEAAAAGMGIALELAAVQRALSKLPLIAPEAFLAINVSPETLCSTALRRALDDVAAERIVLEVTEHASVADYGALEEVRRSLRVRGVRLAVDDTGAGISSLQHVIRLRPDIIKLDRSLIANLESDPVRRALTRALVELAAGLDAVVVAEGIETSAELATLKDLKVAYGQGYLLGRPAALPKGTFSQFRLGRRAPDQTPALAN